MSAIGLVWAWDGDRPVARLQALMSDAQSRYGPDYSASWSDETIALGVNRLDAVPEDRQGITQSIRARVARFGGSAVVRSAPGEGAEVQLFMPRRERVS